MVAFRPAVAAEIGALQRIENEADTVFRAAGHPEYDEAEPIDDAIARAAIERGDLTVAELDGRPVGWACVEPVGKDEIYLRQISVLPGYQRRGVGSSLLLYVIATATGQGVASIVLNTQADVRWNQPWYERFGFFVVPEEDWTPHMQAISRELASAGFDNATRCHMRVLLTGRGALG